MIPTEFDVETGGLQWYAPDGDHEVFLAQFKRPDGSVAVLKHPGDHGAIQQELDRPTNYRAWNSKFDLHHLEAAGYTLPPVSHWEDAMVQAHIVDERKPMALQAQADLLGVPEARKWEKELHAWIIEERKRRRKDVKDNGGEYVPPSYRDVPWSIMGPYSVTDVDQNRIVGEQYASILANNDELRGVYELEMGAMAALYDMERRGIPVDREAAALFERQLLEELEVKHARLQELVHDQGFNPNSSGQVEEALRERGADLTFVSKTKSGKSLSMDEENLSTVDDLLAEAVLDWRSTSKMYGTYVRRMLHDQLGDYGVEYAFLGGDDRLHPNYRQVGARTGRMSASDPNVQNWHRDDLRLRYLVEANPGKVLVTADLDAIEMRLFAAFAGEGPLLQAVRDGRDMHMLAADMVELEDFIRVGGSIETKRQRGKTFNYSVAYGAGLRSLRKKYRVDQNRARQMLQMYKDAFPEVQVLQDTIAEKLYDRGYIKTPYGRRHRVHVRDAYKGTNYLVQGTAADMMKVSLERIYAAGVPVVGVYHDEILAEVDKADAKEAAHVIEEALTDHPRITEIVPIEAEAAIVQRWSQAKDGAYVPAYDTRRNG